VTLLLLAGTSDARRLAMRLAETGLPAVASLAGATREHAALALPTRHGGFGGAEGFEAYLGAQRITAVIDATHPFATRITLRTHAICERRRLPHLRLERPGWNPGPGDRWTFVTDEAEAKANIPDQATVFLATGRQSLPAWGGIRARAYLRVIDPPTGPFPLPGGFVVARPPFDLEAEIEAFRALGITHLVVKDSGGAEGRAKLDAARALGLTVLVLRRPPGPAGLATVASVEEALGWAQELPFRSSSPSL
jgi:precorrin-6A/cobalt-precorrin-6A reductase